MTGPIAKELYKTIHAYCGRMGCEVVELNTQYDYVHLLVSIPPKESVSTLLGMVKGKTAIQIFRQIPHLKKIVLKKTFLIKGLLRRYDGN